MNRSNRCDDCDLRAIASGKCNRHFADLTGGPTYMQLVTWICRGYLVTPSHSVLDLSMAQIEKARRIKSYVDRDGLALPEAAKLADVPAAV